MAEAAEFNKTFLDSNANDRRILEIDDVTHQLDDIDDPGGGKVIKCGIISELNKIFRRYERILYKTDSKGAWVIILNLNESEQRLFLTERQNLFSTDLRHESHHSNLVMLNYVLHKQSTLAKFSSNVIRLYYDVSPTENEWQKKKRRSSLPIALDSCNKDSSLPTDYNARDYSPLVVFVSNSDHLEYIKKNIFTLYGEYQFYRQHKHRQHNPVLKRHHSLQIIPKEYIEKNPKALALISAGVDIPQALNLIDQSTQTTDNDLAFQDCYKGHYDQTKLENLELLNENELLKRKLWEKEKQLQVEKTSMRNNMIVLENEILNWKKRCHDIEKDKKTIEKENKDLLFENGRLLIEMDSKVTREKDIEKFKKIYPCMSNVNACEELVELEAEHTPGRAAQNKNQSNHVGSSSALTNEGNVPSDPLQFPVQVEERNEMEPIGRRNEPLSATCPNKIAYKQLLLAIGHSLLSNDVIKLRDWAHEQFSVETNLIASETMFELDRKGVINPMNLSVLHVFLESILRFDLAHLIHQYCCGDYSNLRQEIVRIKERIIKNAREHNLHHLRSSTTFPTHSHSPRSSAPQEVSERNRQAVYNSTIAMSGSGNQHDTANGNPPNYPQNSPINTRRNNRSSMFEDIADRRFTNKTRGTENSSRGNLTQTTNGASNGITENFRSEQSAAQHSIRDSSAKRNAPSTSHGNGQSYLHSERKQEDRWLCNHYKRRCMVKFECCDKYWPCHRCHNETSTCEQKKLKSRDTTMVKCMECGKEQQFGENGQLCVSCNTRFADFYCGLCKHLTGKDDHPYHCEKCGICRIHGDRSFHCDVCGVCLDVQLRGNHKCRPDSAHDHCGICLEDAFTGCQILPCSHKVHKECSTRMIQSGITRCPICRESFAHKLQKRPTAGKKTTKRR